MITTAPTAGQLTDPTYMKKTTLATIIIGNSLADDLSQSFQYLPSVHAIWQKLASTREGSGTNKFMRIMEDLIHSGDSNASRSQICCQISQLVQQLDNCTHDEEGIGKFYLRKVLLSMAQSSPYLQTRHSTRRSTMLSLMTSATKSIFPKPKSL